MKISIINKLVVGAMIATIVTGCGGSGVNSNSSDFTGIFVPTFTGHSVKSIKNMNGAGELTADMPNNYQPTCEAFDPTGKLFVGTMEGKIVMIQNQGGHPSEMTLPAGKSLGVIWGIAFDHVGRLYINDTTNRKIIRVNDFNGAGWTELDYASYLTDLNNSVDQNLSLAIDSQNRIYMASRNSGMIIRFDSMIDTFPTMYGSNGTTAGHFKDINHLHIDAQDRIYVADRLNNRIDRIDDMTGANWVSFGSQGAGVNQFQNPVSITTDTSGKIYVIDIFNWRIVRINDMTGAGWTTFGSLGSGPGKFENFADILVR